MRRRTSLVLSPFLILPLACTLSPLLALPHATAEPTLPPAPTFPPPYTRTAAPTSAAPLPPTPVLPPDWLARQQQAMRPEFGDDIQASNSRTHYVIAARIDLDLERNQASISGHARIRFSNPLDHPLTEIVLALWPREPTQYLAEMTAGPVLVNGQVVNALDEGLGLRLRLPSPQAPGETLDLSLPFRVSQIGVMHDAAPRRFAIVDNVLLAPTFYPVLPRLVNGQWQLEAPPLGGDTTNSDIALYTVFLTWPARYALASSGVLLETIEDPDGTRSATVVTGPMRDFAIAVGELELAQREVDGIRLQSWLLPQHRSDRDRVLNAATGQLRVLQELLGPYPYAELDVVDAPGAFGGIEYPGLVFIGTVGTRWLVEPVVHEVAHQWFYGLVGNDQLQHPWLDEAAATYAEVLYYETTVGPERATSILRAYRDTVIGHASDPSMPIGLPVGNYPSEQDYALIVYLKGALFFDALRRHLGDQIFFAFLQEYVQQTRYGFAAPQDFQQVAESACGCNLNPLFDVWVHHGGPLPEP